jgi:hypothetical protein
MREENPTPNNTTGPKIERVTKLNERPTSQIARVALQ